MGNFEWLPVFIGIKKCAYKEDATTTAEQQQYNPKSPFIWGQVQRETF